MSLPFLLPTLMASAASIGGALALALFVRSAMARGDKLLVLKTAAGIGLLALFLYVAWGLAGQSEGRDFHEAGMESGKFLIRTLGILAKGL